MNKQIKSRKSKRLDNKKRNIFLGLVIIVILGIGLWYGSFKLAYYESSARQANLVSIRELIISAARGLKKDAPVEPKTGDIFFPESRLYLPNPKFSLGVTYSYDEGDRAGSPGVLSVSQHPLLGVTELYQAENIEQLFDAVPKLQACTRGVKLVYVKYPSTDKENVLLHTQQLNNGKTIYIYTEKACSHLDDLAKALQNIRAY